RIEFESGRHGGHGVSSYVVPAKARGAVPRLQANRVGLPDRAKRKSGRVDSICLSVYIHCYAIRCFPDARRSHSPPHRRGAAGRRTAGQRHRRGCRGPSIRRLASSENPERSRLRGDAAGRTAQALFVEAGAVPRTRSLAGAVSKPLGSAARSLRRRARSSAKSRKEGTGNMNDKANIVIERTYAAQPEELWGLWTTKAGFESWWGPQGFHTDVRRIEARQDGALHYDMVEEAKLDRPPSQGIRGTFSEFKPHERLVLTQIID